MELKVVYVILFLGVGLVLCASDQGDKPAGDVNKPTKNPKDTGSTDAQGEQASQAVPEANDLKKGNADVSPKDDQAKDNVNDTADNDSKDTQGFYQKVVENKGMLLRTFYVLIGVTSIVVLYFVIRTWRTKRRHSKSRKYGLITSSGADLEMEPLDQDGDDDDEMTMFERRK